MSTAELGLQSGFYGGISILETRGRAHQNGNKERGDARRPFERNIGSKAKKAIKNSAQGVRRVLRRGK